MTPQSNPEFAAFIGIDWADAKHDICLQAAGSSKREFAVLSHRPDAIDEWAAALRQRFGGQAVAVCLEIARGPLVYALQKHDFFVLFPVNPATLAKYRQAFQPSHAKGDPADAQIALEILRVLSAMLREIPALAWYLGRPVTTVREAYQCHRLYLQLPRN